MINTKVTADYINRDVSIYGPIFVILKREMVQKRSHYVRNVQHFPLPRLLLDHHKTEQLGVDFMFVNGHVLLVSM